jgi:kynurenine formamidase
MPVYCAPPERLVRKPTHRIRIGTFGLALAAAGCAGKNAVPGQRIVDLTHAFDAATIYWPTEPGFRLDKISEGPTDAGYFYAANRISAPEHGGTHIDAPYHFHASGLKVDAIPLESLVGAGIVVDVSVASSADRDYLVTTSDVLAWEERNGRLPARAIVLLRTGWSDRWPDRERYLGTALTGEAAAEDLHFPGLHPAAAQWLAVQRGIAAVGIDTASIDYGPSKSFASHVALFERNIPALENVANLGALPESGFTVIALPMKIAGGTGAPARIIALLPGTPGP